MKLTCVLLLALATAAAAKEYNVDWKLPSLQSPPRDAFDPLTVAVGDTVVFEWKGGLAYMLYRVSKPVCLESEAAFEKEKGLVLKEYNHAKTSGKLTWKADKAGEFYFVDPDKCGKGMQLTVNVVDAAKATAAAPAAARRLLVVA